MPKELLSLRIESKIVEKLRKYFPGKISELLEKKAEELIQEMEDPSQKTMSFSEAPFQMREDGPYIEYALKKFCDRQTYEKALNELSILGLPVNSMTISKMIDTPAPTVPSKSGTWPGKVNPSMD